MADHFTDIPTDEESGDDTAATDSTANSGDTPTNTVADNATFGDSKSVRPVYDGHEDLHTELRYEDPDGEGKADDTDARGLFRQPTLNELRYYAREGPYGEAIIRKPVQDAFKNGFTVHGDHTEGSDAKTIGTIESFLQDIQETYVEAKIKARRDGMAVLMYVTADEQMSVADPIPTDPPSSASFEGFQLWTVDNLSDDLTNAEVAEHTEYSADQIYISEGAVNGGVAVVDDITHPDHGEIIGYGVEPREDSEQVRTVEFVHADRCHHFTHGDHVDGPYGNNLTGNQIGESALTPVLQPLKATQMGFWALSQILLRYSAPLHAIEPPESWNEEEFDMAREKLEDISMASDAVLPPGSELSVSEGVTDFDPKPYYDTLVEAICAGTVFTKSVLQGTQTGTVSGSETDVKGYFSEVKVLRQQEFEPDLRAIAKKVSTFDQSTVPRVSDVENVIFEWGPLFKPTDVQQAEGAVSLITAATNGVKNYVLSPDEARSVLSEEWARFNLDVNLEDLTEDQMDTFDRINKAEAGHGPSDNEPDVRENPTLQNGGGQPEGQTRSSSDPASGQAGSVGDSLTHDLVAAFGDANYTSGDIVATPNGIGVVSGTLTEDVKDLPGGGHVDATDGDYYVVGLGGAFGIYRPDDITARNVNSPEKLRNLTRDERHTDGDTVYYYDGDVSITEASLPDGWVEASLLSWWASVGGEWDEAKSELASADDISESQAEKLAAEYKQAVLGTAEQVER